jgi:hypothetical protein
MTMKKEKPQIAIGSSDFKEIVAERKCLYIDKTDFITKLCRDSSKVMLFTRPRRFGKTLNLSMLKYFFEQKNTEENRTLFNNLLVAKQPEAMAEQGSRPVVFLSFRTCGADTWEKTLMLIKNMVAAEIKRLLPDIKTENLENCDWEILNSLKHKQASFDELVNSLALLCEALAESCGVKPLVLIDEYDVPLRAAWLESFWKEAAAFMGNFFSAALKDNSFIWKAVVTGCMRIAKESIFTGVNNFNVYSVTNPLYAEYFGFTPDEVKTALKVFELEDRFFEVQDWYDGYKFGEQTIYNPWSVLKWLASGDLDFKPYWVNTSSNDLVHSILHRSGAENKQQLAKLIDGETIKILLNEEVVFPEIENSPESIWNFLFAAGYLKADSFSRNDMDDVFVHLKIPNREIKRVFRISILRWFENSGSRTELLDLGKYLRTGDGESFTIAFKKMVRDCFSYFDVGQDSSENFYHAFTLGLMVHLYDVWKIKSNREAGMGRSDILMLPLRPEKDFGIILEFKRCENKKELTQMAEKALQQITEKDYAAELQSAGAQKIMQIGIAFYGKTVEIALSHH